MLAAMAFTLCASSVNAQFTLVARVDPQSGTNRYSDVWGAGDYAYVGSYSGKGVWIFDISDPSNAFLETRYNPRDPNDNSKRIQFKDVKVDNGIGYFSSDTGYGMHVVDLSDPTSPTLLSTITSSNGGGFNSIHNSFINGNLLYQSDSRTNVVKVIDVTDPTTPTFVRNITTTDSRFIHDVTALGDRLYTSGFGGKTDIYDVGSISVNDAPVLLGSFDSGPNSHSSWVTADESLLVNAREIEDGDITLWDISDPANAILKSTINKTDLGIEAFSPHNPVIIGDTLYVAWYEGGLQAFDISDPSNPITIGSFDTFDGSGLGNWGVYPFLGPDRILLSDSSGGLFIVTSVPEPSSLLLVCGLGGIGLFIRKRRRKTVA